MADRLSLARNVGRQLAVRRPSAPPHEVQAGQPRAIAYAQYAGYLDMVAIERDMAGDGAGADEARRTAKQMVAHAAAEWGAPHA